MPTIQELLGKSEEHKLELNRHMKNGDDKKRRTLALKVATSIEENEDEVESVEGIYDDVEKIVENT